ncbi:MAG: DUF4347 domain-containing protein [Pirellulales bacterium]
MRNPAEMLEQLRHYWQKLFGPQRDVVPPMDACRLEDRVLYSATIMPVDWAEVQQATDSSHGASVDSQFDQIDDLITSSLLNQQSQDSSAIHPTDDILAALELALSDLQSDPDTANPTSLDNTNSPQIEVVFVDDSLPDFQAIVNDLQNKSFEGTQLAISVIDSSRDGISQISDFLQQLGKEADAVHLITNSTEGQLRLGNTSIDHSTIGFHQSAIESWNNSLTNGAELHIYGSDLNSSTSGRDLLATLSELTGTELANVDLLPIDESYVLSSDSTRNSGLPTIVDETEYNSAEQTTSILVSDLQSNSASIANTPDSTSLADSANQLFFIDTGFDGWQELAAKLQSVGEVVILDAQHDGLQTITETLANYSDLSSIAIISHGTDASVQVGSTLINDFTLQWQSDVISKWHNSLAEDGDILIFGCDVASSQHGRDFVNQLSQITGADVAASTDLTGFSGLGGNWDLEYSTGVIAANPELANELSEWFGTLAISANGTASSSSSSSTTSLVWSHTIASGTNTTLFVTLDIDGLGASVSSVKWGTTNLTQVGRTAGNHAVEIWKLDAPYRGDCQHHGDLGCHNRYKSRSDCI